MRLKCPKCGRVQRVPREEDDPPTATMALWPCAKCASGDTDASVEYRDAKNRVVLLVMPGEER